MKKEKLGPETEPKWLSASVGVDEGFGIVLRMWSAASNDFRYVPLAKWLGHAARSKQHFDIRKRDGRIFEGCRLVVGHVLVPAHNASETYGDHPPKFHEQRVPDTIVRDREAYIVTVDGLPIPLRVETRGGKVVWNDKDGTEIDIRVSKLASAATHRTMKLNLSRWRKSSDTWERQKVFEGIHF